MQPVQTMQIMVRDVRVFSREMRGVLYSSGVKRRERKQFQWRLLKFEHEAQVSDPARFLWRIWCVPRARRRK